MDKDLLAADPLEAVQISKGDERFMYFSTLSLPTERSELQKMLTKSRYLCLDLLGHVWDTSERRLSPAQCISHLKASSTKNPMIPPGQANGHSGRNGKIIGRQIYKRDGVSRMVGKCSCGPQEGKKMAGVRILHQSQ